MVKRPTEESIIEKIRIALSDSFKPSQNLVLGMGDDCALFKGADQDYYAVSKDMLIEGIHFLQEISTPADIGFKALAVNLSDLAAKGAEPMGYLMGLAIPEELSPFWADEFLSGMRECANLYGVQIWGGDVSRSLGDMAISITVIGKLKEHQVKLRKDGLAGDQILVTGFLGDSAAGLELLLKDREATGSEFLKFRQRRPIPHVSEGQWLANQSSVHAMMDLSDGLMKDLDRLCKASQCSAEVEILKLPISSALEECCSETNWDGYEFAISGGEDYGLLLTVNDREAPSLIEEFKKQFRTPITSIGKLGPGQSPMSWLKNGTSYSPKKSPFEHFNPV
ncbi:MAG: thiamine-phosphate kinase [Oligoflexia bacterium]|nr:thiamine-phosphate kinase [Oligoflexia bacterium]